MIALHPEYIVDQHEHKKSVVLPFNEWEILISDIEELDDIRAFDAAKTDNEGVKGLHKNKLVDYTKILG